MITIYTIEECYLQIPAGGQKYPVAGFKFDLPENGIPSIVITTDDNVYNKKASDTVPPAKTPSPGDLIKTYNKFQAFCDKKEKAKFYFKAIGKNEDGEDDEQEITLTGWLCTAAGFSSIQATGYSAFNVTLHHPIHPTSSGPSSLLNILSTDPLNVEADLLNSTDPYHGLLIGLNQYIKAMSGAGSGDSKPDTESQKTQFNEAIEAIRATMIDGLDNYPISNSRFVPAFKLSMYDYATNFKESSIWNMLVGTLCSEFALSIKPADIVANDYNFVTISSLQPWEEPAYIISIANVVNIQLPSNDLEPVAGAACIASEDIGTSVSSLGNSAGDELNKTFFDGSSYTEKKDGKPIKGAIIRVGIPNWFLAGMRTNVGNTGSTASPNQDELPIDSLIIETVLDKYEKELKDLTKTLFMIKYKQAVNAVFTMRLFTKYDATELFLPGVVVKLVDDKKNEELMRGYITNILHVVDIANKQAQTEVSMRYVRQAGFKIDGKEALTTPIWESGG